MKIDNVASGSRFFASQMPAGSTDSKVKNIQSKITDAQQQMQKLSSKEELTADEKEAERKKLQKEILGLNNKLRQHQEDMRRSQKRELLAKEQQADVVSAKEKKTDDRKQSDETAKYGIERTGASDGKLRADRQDSVIFKNGDGSVKLKDETGSTKKSKETDEKDVAGLSGKKVNALVSADGSVQQASQVGRVILRTKDGIVILKGEIEQDKRYGSDTKQKQEELEKRNKRVQRAQAFQFSILGQAHNTLKSAAKPHKNETQDNGQSMRENKAFISTLRPAAAEQASRQEFHVSFR